MAFIFIGLLTAFSYSGEFYDHHVSHQDAAPQDTLFVQELLTGSLADINEGMYTEAYAKIQKAEELSDSLQYTGGKTLAITRKAEAYLNQQKNDSVIVLLNEAIQTYPESPDRITFHNFLGTAYGYKNENRPALENYEKAIELAGDMPEEEQARTTAGVRMNMAGIYMNQGNTKQAFENYLTAVRFSESTGDTLFWVTTLNNIGNAYNDVESYDEAAFYLEKAMGIAENKSLKNELYRIHLNLANTRSNQERFEDAAELYNKALEIEREIRPGSPPVVLYYNLGRLNTQMGNFEESEDYFVQSLKFAEEGNIPQGIYYNNLGLGKLYAEQQEYEQAISYLETAYKVAVGLQNIPFIQTSREELYHSYREANQFESAFYHLENFKETADSLFDQEKEQALANLESQLALDRQSEINRLLQEKQVQQESKLQFQLILIITAGIVLILVLVILVLVKKTANERKKINSRLQKQKKELEEINRDKDKLFAIIAHDLRSPLISMHGILYLIKNSALSKEEIKKLAQELEATVQENMDAMEDLLAWAKEQLSGVSVEIDEVNVYELTEEVFSRQSFIAAKKGIALKSNIAENQYVLADRNALELVLRNLVNNGIKFSNSRGLIRVESKTNGQMISIMVKDTGIGIPAEAADKIFDSKSWTRKGTGNEKGTGFGLSLAKEFMKKMNGSIRFESREGKGTTFFIELPKVPGS
ncbi:MAG: tetratricopeptide repeat-containing sensor histidine kinase [Balneolaceae bacterium]